MDRLKDRQGWLQQKRGRKGRQRKIYIEVRVAVGLIDFLTAP